MALMAPEVATARPGAFATINYERSDLWTAATMAYQIFGGQNPFYCGLESRSYKLEQLPPMPEATPPLLVKLVSWCLVRWTPPCLYPDLDCCITGSPPSDPPLGWQPQSVSSCSGPPGSLLPRLTAIWSCSQLLGERGGQARYSGYPPVASHHDHQGAVACLPAQPPSPQVVCESRYGNSGTAQLEYTLVATFLATLSLGEVRGALHWVQELREGED